MKHRETPLSHVLFVMALGFVILVVINLLGCEWYPCEEDSGPVEVVVVPHEPERDTLLRENEELHYNNMIRARIIEELMERVDRCEEKP